MINEKHHEPSITDLDEDYLQMTRDELLLDIAYRIQAQREALILDRKERTAIKAENKELWEEIIRGTGALENASMKMREYDIVIKNGTKTILMWRNTCYFLVFILIFIALVLMIK